jgi:hypothetical protein
VHIAALLAVVVTLLTAFDAVIPHHDDAAIPHSAENDDCGCACHVAVDAVVTALTLEIHHAVASVENLYAHSQPDPPYASIDRPPELFS